MDVLVPSLIERLIPDGFLSSDGLLGLLWVRLLLLVLTLLLCRRHGFIAYGSEHTSWLAVPVLAILYLSLFRLSPSISVGLLALCGVVYIVESWILSIARSKRFLPITDQGFVFSLLIAIHPGFLILVPILLLRLRRIHLLSMRHFSCFMMGLLSGLALWVMLFSPTSLGGVYSYLSSKLIVLLSPSSVIHERPQLYLYIITGLEILFLTIFVKGFYESALERHRLIVMTHLMVLYSLYALTWLYGTTTNLFMVSTLFFMVVLMQLFYAKTKDVVWLVLVSLPVLTLSALSFIA